MENILMRFCRETNNYSPREVARKLGITTEAYRSMEKGELLLSRKQAKQLGDLYNVTYTYFYKEAEQLDLLLTRMAIIKLLKWENNQLIEAMKKNLDEPQFPLNH